MSLDAVSQSIWRASRSAHIDSYQLSLLIEEAQADGMPPEERAAIRRFILSSGDAFTPDAKVEAELFLRAYGGSESEMDADRAIDIVRDNFSYLDTAAQIGRRDGLIGTVDLEAALKDPDARPDVKAAARYLLQHPEVFAKLDTASQGGKADGLISKADLDVGQRLLHLDPRSATLIVREHFSYLDTAAGIGKPDGIIARSDLEAAIRDPNAPSDLKAAAHYLLDHPELYAELDDAAHVLGHNDGLIASKDIDAWLAAHPERDSWGSSSGGDFDTPHSRPALSSWFTAPEGTRGHGNDPLQNQIEDVLSDPSLTVEDKVTLFLMLVMKKMDKDIEAQADYIEQLQQQQNKAAADARLQGKAPPESNASIDVESQKLARLVTKRNQMFDILRSIIDKYNETAKNIIQSLGR
jgi:hypothetical protein